MTWFLIDNEHPGTRAETSDGIETRPSGAWDSIPAGDKFPIMGDLEDAHANPPQPGDIIVVRADNREVATATDYMDLQSEVLMITSDPTDFDTYQKATGDLWSTVTSGQGLRIQNPATTTTKFCRIKGFQWRNELAEYWSTIGCRALWFDVDFQGEKSNDQLFQVHGAGAINTFRNCNIHNHDAGHNYANLEIQNGAVVNFFGGSLTRAKALATQGLVNTVQSGATFYGAAVDCATGAGSGALISQFHTSGGSKQCRQKFYRCKLPANWAFNNIDVSMGNIGTVVSCDSEHQYIEEQFSGSIEAVSDVYRDDAPTLRDGTTKISMQYITSADCDQSAPLRLGGFNDQQWYYAENDEAATKNKLRVEIAIEDGDTLDTGDISVEAVYPDSTTSYHGRYAYHDLAEPFEVGSALSTEATSGTWTDADSNNLATNSYYFLLTLPNAGNGPVDWNVSIKKPNVVCWVNPVGRFVA